MTNYRDQASSDLDSNRLGLVRQVLDSTATAQFTQTFDPYGNLYAQSVGASSGPPSFGYTGEYMDDNGLVYLRARYYQPSIGRFTQPDPFDGALSLPASLNQYSYTHGNPVNYADPSGQCIDSWSLLGIALPWNWAGVAEECKGNISIFTEVLNDPEASSFDKAWTLAFNVIPSGISIRNWAAQGAYEWETINRWVNAGPAGRLLGRPDTSSYYADRPDRYIQDFLVAFGPAYNIGTFVAFSVLGPVKAAANSARYEAEANALVARRLAQLEADIPYGNGGRLMAMVRRNEARRIVEQAGRTYTDYTISSQYSGVQPLMQHGGGEPLGPYRRPGQSWTEGGHHIHQQAAFAGHPNYNPRQALALRHPAMTQRGYSHSSMTTMQRELYDELAESFRGVAPSAISMREHNRIAVEALMAGGVSRQLARDWVAASLRNLRNMGVDMLPQYPGIRKLKDNREGCDAERCS